MIGPQLVAAVLSMALSRLFQTSYGMLGVLGLVVLGAGVRGRHAGCASIGAVMLILAMTQA